MTSRRRPPVKLTHVLGALAALLMCATVAAADPAAVMAQAPRAPILPPSNPAGSLAVGRYLPTACRGIHDRTRACMDESLGMINAGRRSEGLGPVILPANWTRLDVAQQMFVLTELERTARGLPADSGLVSGLNDRAVAGADAGHDPTGGGSGFEALWAGGEPNAIVVIADWIYEDGRFADGFSENLNCSSSSSSGCWQHRDILLHDGAVASCGTRCAVGAGYSPDGYRSAAGVGRDSYAEVLAPRGSGAATFTWATEERQLPACERARDSCGWGGVPVLTANGVAGGRGSAGGSGGSSGGSTGGSTGGSSGGSTGGGSGGSTGAGTNRPRFSVRLSSRVHSGGRVEVLIHLGARIRGVRVFARLGRRLSRMHVRRRGRYFYIATARLSRGRWTLTVRYLTSRRRDGPSSRAFVTVPRVA